MAKAKISSKGQVTIPIEVRKWLGVKAGDKVEFARRNGDIIVRPARDERESPFAKYTGILGDFPGGVEEINAWIRDMRDED
ncbi:MAG: AbrB/MazE/SpoVT family DNA-binding domain-containing protein [Terriglobales bacterium]